MEAPGGYEAALAIHLHAAGKPKLQVVGTCMRKLVMICHGVLKHRTPFDPRWSSRIAA